MKILFVITSINSKSGGLGGHYHSLIETVNQISKEHEVVIVNIGNKEAKALQDTNYKIYKIIYPGYLFFKTYKNLKQILIDEKPDVLHAFDSLAHYWTRLIGRQLHIPYCLTKCGGINPVYSPYAKSLILYSNENYNFYNRKKKFRNSSLYLIPNRIKQFDSDAERIEQILQCLGEEYRNSFKFLRIARIGKYYRSSSLQLINLVTKLKNDGIECCAIFVGKIEDKIYFDELKNKDFDNIFFFTNDIFTKNAKAIIDCADAVLGTGRSFMEAAAKEKILLAPAMNATIPALIQSENFQQAFNYNFSERIKFINYNDNKNYNVIKKAIHYTKFKNELTQFSKNIFNDYFDSNKITEKHENVYAELDLGSNKHIFDFFLHTLFIIRSYYR